MCLLPRGIRNIILRALVQNQNKECSRLAQYMAPWYSLSKQGLLSISVFCSICDSPVQFVPVCHSHIIWNWDFEWINIVVLANPKSLNFLLIKATNKVIRAFSQTNPKITYNAETSIFIKVSSLLSSFTLNYFISVETMCGQLTGQLRCYWCPDFFGRRV